MSCIGYTKTLDLSAGQLVRLDDAKNASLRARDLAQQLLTFARGGAPIKKSASISKLIEETVSFPHRRLDDLRRRG